MKNFEQKNNSFCEEDWTSLDMFGQFRTSLEKFRQVYFDIIFVVIIVALFKLQISIFGKGILETELICKRLKISQILV